MEDIAMYRNELYDVIDYHENGLTLADSIGNEFDVTNKDLQAPPIGRIHDF